MEGENRQKEGAQTEEKKWRVSQANASEAHKQQPRRQNVLLLWRLCSASPSGSHPDTRLTLGFRVSELRRLCLWLEVEKMRNCRRLREFVLRSAFLSRLHRTIVSSPGPPQGAAQVHMHVTWFSHTESPTPCENNNYISHESLRNQTALIKKNCLHIWLESKRKSRANWAEMWCRDFFIQSLKQTLTSLFHQRQNIQQLKHHGSCSC